MFTLFAFAIPLLTLTALVLFQTGVLYGMGLTMLTSDMMVQGIMYALAITTVFSLIAMIKSAVANKAIRRMEICEDVEHEPNEKTAARKEHKKTSRHTEQKNNPDTIPAAEQEPEPVADDVPDTEDEPEEPESAPAMTPEQIEETETAVASIAVDVADEPVSQEPAEETDMQTIEDILNGARKEDTHEEEPVAVAPQNVPEEEPAQTEPAQAEEPAKAAETEANATVSEEEQNTSEGAGEENIAPQLTDFEHAVKKLMDKANIPENLYAIEEYKEGAICLIHDAAHYFVYMCKNDGAKEVEYFPISAEKETAEAFVRRVQEIRNCA